MPYTLLIGGGRDADRISELLLPFSEMTGDGPVACVMVDDGDGVDVDRWTWLLLAAGINDVHQCVLHTHRRLGKSDVAGCTGVFVAGGLTPLYAKLVVPWGALFADLPYAGFSAGAAIAGARAIVGGWRDGDVELCPEEASEDLDQLTVVPGLGRVPFAVDVHASEWGTIGRAEHAVKVGLVDEVYALDEHTALNGDTRAVTGAGRAHHRRG